MTKATIDTQNSKIERNYISQLLERLTVDYQNTKQERKEIAASYPTGDEEFSILEEIELLTVDIRGYACQIQAYGWIKNEQQAIEQLQNMRIFDVPALAEFYLTSDRHYDRMKAYIQMLDYLRLLMIEYLHTYQTSQPKSA